MNARDDAHRTTVAVTSGLAVAALATTITVGLVVARSSDADAATGTSDTSTTSDTGTSSDSAQSDQSTQPDQSTQSSSGSSGRSGISPGSGSADATSGGS